MDAAEFKAWFADSQVVDSEGAPLVVYHGTSAKFDTFDTNKQEVKGGFFFVSNSEAAREVYAWRKRDHVMAVYLKMARPLGYDEYFELTGLDKDSETNGDFDAPVNYFDNNSDDVLAFAKSNGFDGLMWPSDPDSRLPHDLLVVFRPDQIKSLNSLKVESDPDEPEAKARSRKLRR